MRIAYCIDSLALSGGTERVVTTKLNWLSAQKEIKVWVITLKETEKPFFALSSGIERIMLPVTPGNRKKYRIEIAKSLCEIKPDVVVSVAGLAVDVIPSLKLNTKTILEFHYTKNFLVNFVKGLHKIRFRQLHILKMKWLQWKLSQTAKKYDLFVGLTKKDVGLWGSPDNMTYIHNPLSFRSHKKSDCTSKRIISVGSWTPAKGMDQLLEAFGPLAKKYPDWHVDLYGSGQDESLLRSIIAKHGMASQVTLNGPVANISEKLIESSIYAFPSRSDGFGLVITEAMECGLPTVAMDCPCGPCEIVTPNTGIVVPDKDITAFRNALEKLMTNDGLRKQMGNAAQTEVRRFYPDAIMPHWLQLFAKQLYRK